MSASLIKGRSFSQLGDIAWGKLSRFTRQALLPMARSTTRRRTDHWLETHASLIWPLHEDEARTLLQRHPEERDRILSEADSAVAGWAHVSGFGRRRIELSPRPDVSPEEQYAYRLTSRLDFLRPLVQAFLLTDRGDYQVSLEKLLLEWSRVRRSKAEWDTVDDSIRLLNLLEALSLLQDRLKPEIVRSVLITVLLSAWNIETRRTRTGNHLIYEGLALLACGTALQSHPRSKHWRRLGRLILEKQMDRQVRPDGMHGELCANYHLITSVNFLKAWSLAQVGGGSSDRYRRRLALMCGVAGKLQASDGGFIALGDSDRMAGPSREEREGRAFAQFKRSPTKPTGTVGENLTLDQDWLMAGAGAGWLDEPNDPGPESAQDFGGYCLRRERNGNLLIFDAGPFGLEGASHHGHADALSFEVHLRGTRFLVDPGGFSYVDHAARAFARSTAAHNTIRVDDRDSTAITGSFDFGRTAKARCLEARPTCGGCLFSGEHDGYAPVTHRRHLFWLPGPPMLLLLIDRLVGTGSHTLEAFHHSDAGWQGQTIGDHRVIWSKDQHRLVQIAWSTQPGVMRLVQGVTGPSRQGWVSKTYGEYLAAPVSIYQCSAELPVIIVNAFMETQTEAQDVILDGAAGKLVIGGDQSFRWKFEGELLQIAVE